MDLSNDKKNSKKITLGMILITAIFCVCALLIATVTGFGRMKYYDLNGGASATVTRPDGEKTHYSSAMLPDTKKGDEIEFTIQLPQILEDYDWSLVFYQYHSEVEVYFGDTLLESYGKDLTHEGKMYGNQLIIVHLPKRIAGKVITVRSKQMEISTSNRSTYFRLMPLEDARFYPLIGNKLLVIFYTIAFLVSFVLLISSLVFRICHMYFSMDATLIAVFSMLISLWQLASRRLLYTVMWERDVCSNIEYFALFFSTIPFFLYMMKVNPVREYKILYMVISGIFAIFDVAVTAIHFILGFHIPNFERVFYLMLFIAMIITLVVEMKQIRLKRSQQSRTLSRGLMIAALLACCQIIVITIRTLFRATMTESFLNIDFSTFAILFLVFYLFISLGRSAIEGVQRKAEQEQVKAFAYTDFLTDIPNRLSLSETMRKIDESGNDHYGVIFFDLDYLKYGNDKYGHELGDRMLRDAADILRRSFGNFAGKYGRWGSDEFVAVFENYENMPAFVKKFNRLVAQVNEDQEFPFHYSISYGAAYKAPNDNKTCEELCKQADSNMYEYKKANHILRDRLAAEEAKASGEAGEDASPVAEEGNAAGDWEHIES